jgi:hypothetical protein
MLNDHNSSAIVAVSDSFSHSPVRSLSKRALTAQPPRLLRPAHLARA